ncbi:MAG: hypothetical protein J1D77_04120 [Muribaculaceae bacterium]|nr:hypothetical protein [Muribaculaceae bacterium]
MYFHIKDKFESFFQTIPTLSFGKIVKGFVISGLLLSLSSCEDKDLGYPDDNDLSFSESISEGLTFAVNLAKEQGTRAEDEIDDYVDINNRFQVLVFSQNGDFLFESINRVVQPSGDIDGQWYVTIPFDKEIKDRGGNTFSLSLIKSQLEKEGFKIAVLANWPGNANNPKVNWGWSDSKLNPNASSIKNINDLHHIEADTYYSSTSKYDSSVTDDGVINSRKQAYDFILDGDNRMGVNTDWVKMSSDDYVRKGNEDTRWTADRWIRNNWDPSKDKDVTPDGNEANRIKGYYTKLWQYWNFSVSMDKPDESIQYPKIWTLEDKNLDQEDNIYKNWDKEWQGRNGDEFKKLFDNKNHLSNLETDSDIDGLIIDLKRKDLEEKGQFQIYKQNGLYGIVLSETDAFEYTDKKNENSTDFDAKPRIKHSSNDAHGFIQFKAYGTGTFRIKYMNGLTKGTESRLVVQRTSNNVRDWSVKDVDSPTVYTNNINITEDPEEITIFCQKGKVVILAIEWVSNKYLYDSDRSAVMPDRENQPIPMYGVQNYNKIDNWTSGALINLSQNIYLIRSVAKVELYLPKQASFVNMRSMNRKARCEPMDVETPTLQGWTKFTGQSYHTSANCEWFDIQKYGPLYGTTENFKDWYSWFYGAWKYKYNTSSKKNEERNPSAGDWAWGFSGINVPTISSLNGKGIETYPRIFNPDVERSDFCEMYYAGEAEGYHKYVVYMPDKGIDDPNNAGKVSDTPKVPHIEYRYNYDDCFLDDNNCLRIYFTDYVGNITDKNPNIGNVLDTGFSDYEENKDNLKYHWPIMRNHRYKFYVGGTYESQEIYVKVSEWGNPAEAKREEW